MMNGIDVLQFFTTAHPIKDFVTEVVNAAHEDALGQRRPTPYGDALVEASSMRVAFGTIAETVPKLSRGANDMFGKFIVAHGYGERMAILFRSWVRSRLNPADELKCGGASIESYYDIEADSIGNFKGAA